MERKSHFDEGIFQDYIKKIRSSKDIHKQKSTYTSAVTWINWLKDTNNISLTTFNALSIQLENALKKDTKKISTISKRSFLNNYIFIILVIFTAGSIASNLYLYSLINTMQESLQNKEPVGRVLPFKGTIKETNGQPLDTKRDAMFTIYNVVEQGTSLYTGSCVGENGLVPSFNGSFTILIGSDCGMKPIPERIFKDNQTLYLGVSLGNDPELQPRYQIMTSSFSQDTSKLQGLSIGTNISSIPYINEEGFIELENESPSIKATNGNFIIEGETLTLRSTKDGANIVIDPATSADVIIGSGNVGIGTYAPQTYLDVSGNKLLGSVASFTNYSRQDSLDSSVLTLSLGTDPSASESQFIEFYAGKNELVPGVKVGGIRLNNQSVVYETSAADFAEYFEVNDSSLFGLYKIVAITADGIKPAIEKDHVIGIVSNTAGYIGNIKYKKVESILVALVGQVDVLITNINGEIQKGDRIGTSQIEGYGRKVRSNMDKIGYALENTQNNLRNDSCPTEIRHIKTVENKNIACGKISIIINLD
ncbi:MAG TPA: peptidase G2 autoproteolytic cleavage domain-containing protein [Candidatus Woesebacteria bacterium]|nr:peptidase G2 autoproteolytic cleavage domain-containing protein [Candidatus Woesebacteria bacterium]